MPLGTWVHPPFRARAEFSLKKKTFYIKYIFLNIMRDDNHIKETETLILLKERFTKLFNERGYKSSDKFDKNVWFLKNKLKSSLLPGGITPTGGNNDEMLDILEKTSSNGANMNKLDVKVDDFINEISKTIFDYHNHKVKIEENLTKIGLKKIVTKIKNDEKNDKNFSNKYKYLHLSEQDFFKKSKVKFLFSAINGLSDGEHKITINYKLNSNDDYFTNKKATIFLINKLSKNLERPIKLEIILEESFSSENIDRKIFPIKEYYFDIEKNNRNIFTSESVSFDPFVLQLIDSIYDKSELYITGKKDFEEENDKGEKKFSIEYNINAFFDKILRNVIVNNTVVYYDNLVKGIESLQGNINTLKGYFEEIFTMEIDDILKGHFNQVGDSCACSNCLIF